MEDAHRDAPKPESSKIRRLISCGSGVVADVSANMAGSAIGFVVGGPAGAVVGRAVSALASNCFRKIGEEITARKLSPREEARVGHVFVLAAAEIQKRLEAGERVRNDGFFDSAGAGRSDAEEVIESVLLKSQREPEERKLPYMALLLSSIAFDKRISAEMAHQITKAASDMTFRQLCILRMSAVKDKLDLHPSDYRN